jgi:ferredoxin
LEIVTTGIKANPDSCQTQRPAVFAAGRAVKPVNQLVRAMTEGQGAADCINRFLAGKKIARRDRPFSSIMGRLEKPELAQFLKSASPAKKVSPCDMCAGFKPAEGAAEASRCLHCDCRSSGNCALQTYAQVYGADASRYRQQRRAFEQHIQPGGVIFEPGKCILCGICVKLTELAREPLGLTFVGRGFDVRVAAPFNHTIEAGLQKVGAECVEHCPTGALTFREVAAIKTIGDEVMRL